jgi:hypothetical protein
VKVIFAIFGRQLVTTVLFSDVLLKMTVTNWRQDKSRRAEDKGQSIDTFFQNIESEIGCASDDDENSNTDEELALE